MSLRQRLNNLARKMKPNGRVIVIEAADGQDIEHLLEPLGVRTPPEITASLSLPGFQRIIPLWVELVARYREGLHFFIRNFNSLWVEVVV